MHERGFSKGKLCWSAKLGVILLCASSVQTVRAAGIEDTVSGTVALGRAANHVRVNDFMATWQNPANLAVVHGLDLGGELRLPSLSACFDRARVANVEYREPDTTTAFQGSESFGAVCNDASPLPSGNLGLAHGLRRGIGYGIGLFTPAGVGRSAYGTDTVVTVNPLPNETLPITASGIESPTRQMLVSRKAMAAWLMAGLGYQPWKVWRLGLSLGAGFAKIQNTSVSSAAGGSFRDQEVLTEVSVADWFVPRAVLSTVVTPLDSLELMAALTYQADVNATGHVDLTANGIQGAPLGDCRAADPESPGPRCRADGVKLRAPFPTWEATLGIRYAKRKVAHEGALVPMRDEVWDVELDAFWAQTSHVDENRVEFSDPSAPDAARILFTSDPMGIPLYTPSGASIPKHWRDTYGVRAGGDYHVIAERLSLRAGLSYQSSAVKARYMNIDSWPVQKVGVHVGASLGLGKVTLSAAYAHLFFASVDVPIGTGEVREVVSQMPDAAQAVNEGYYTAGLDVFSVQGNLTF